MFSQGCLTADVDPRHVEDTEVEDTEVEDTEVEVEVDVIRILQSARLTHTARLDDLRSAFDEALFSERLAFQSEIMEILDGQ